MSFPQSEKTDMAREEPAVVKKNQSFIQKVIKNITIEPAMFLIAFSSSIDNISSQQLIVMKACKVRKKNM